MTLPPDGGAGGVRNPTGRFTDRVANYVLYRPNYPSGVLDVLREETGLTSEHVIADIGSGTGISSELFLRNGNGVYGVEPNEAMRSAAVDLEERYGSYRCVDGTAEATGLASASVAYVVAGQAFHWFDQARARTEFARILEPDGWVVLLWNARRTDSTPFLREYERLLRTFGTDYGAVQHTNIDIEYLRPFFAPSMLQLRRLYNEQRFDFEGLKGRLLSSSYVPSEGHPRHRPMLQALRARFDERAEEGEVCFEYDTEVYFGRLG
ncbi:MAG: methyltransferase domain-containing protein [Gemmatimonadota bacterium]